MGSNCFSQTCRLVKGVRRNTQNVAGLSLRALYAFCGVGTGQASIVIVELLPYTTQFLYY